MLSLWLQKVGTELIPESKAISMGFKWLLSARARALKKKAAKKD